MNFWAARNAAEGAARQVSRGVQGCPKQRTGLIVLVYGYGDGNEEALPNIDVTVGATQGTTADNGLAQFVPLDPGQHVVHVTRPIDRADLIEPDDDNVTIELGTCSVDAMQLTMGKVPKIKIVWDHDNSGVAGAVVEIVRGSAVTKTTGNDGIADWTGELLRPYRYSLKTVFQDGIEYMLFSEGREVPTPGVALARTTDYTFKIKRQPVTFRVQKQTGATTTELVGAKVKLAFPDSETATTLTDQKAVVTFTVPATKETSKSCQVVSLKPDDVDDDVYEVIGVTEA